MTFQTTLLALVFMVLPGFALSDGMTFQGKGNGGTCYGGCFWIEAQGEILPSTPGTAAVVLAKPGPPDLVFNSDGGDKAAGMELGRIIRKEGKNTGIGTSVPIEGDNRGFAEQGGPGVCRGACAIAFLGGKTAQVGALGFYEGETSAILEFEPLLSTNDLADFKSGSASGEERLEDQRLIGAFVKYLLDMGVSPRLYETISQLAPGTTLQLDDAGLNAFSLQAENLYPDGWKLKLLGKGLAMQFHRLRLFCKGAPENMHLQMVYEELSPKVPKDDPMICNDYACIDDYTLRHYQDKLTFYFGDGRLPAKYNGAYQSPSEGVPLLLDFSVDDRVIDRLANSESVAVSFPTESRPEIMALDELSYGLPDSLDPRLLPLLKNNCL